MEWLSLGEGKPGFAVVSGGTWQGYTVSSLSVYNLADPALKDLAQGVSLYSSSEGACVEESDNCWEVKGKWRFEKRDGQAFDDLVLDFSGYRERRPDGAPEDQPRSRTDLKGVARYRFNGRVYGLVEGENIVPKV